MQEIETTKNFSAEAMIMQEAAQMSIEQNIKQLDGIIKKHVMNSFNYVCSKFPIIKKISWYQTEINPCINHYEIKVNGLDYFKIFSKKRQYDSSEWDCIKDGTKMQYIKVGERYSLFKDQLKEDFKRQQEEFDLLIEATRIFSKEIEKINPLLMLLIFGRRVTITVSEGRFDYQFDSVQTCDG